MLLARRVFITLNTIQLAFTLISVSPLRDALIQSTNARPQTIYALDTVGAVIVFTDPYASFICLTNRSARAHC